MLVVMSHSASEQDVGRVVQTIRDMGYDARPIPGRQRTAIGLVGNDGKVDSARLESLPGVLEVIHVTQPYKQVSREWRSEPTAVELQNGTRIGTHAAVVMAGTASVEWRGRVLGGARRRRAGGGAVLGAGAFRPRTSPCAFQGRGVKGLEVRAEARQQAGLAVVTEALETDTVAAGAEFADIIQLGGRNMQN